MTSFETSDRLKSHGIRSDLLIVDSVSPQMEAWDPLARHEPWPSDNDHSIRTNPEPLKSLSARVIARHCTQLTPRMLSQGNWAAWKLVWEHICNYGYDSFDILILFAHHFRYEKSFTCMGERITKIAKSHKKCRVLEKGKSHYGGCQGHYSGRQRLIIDQLSSRRHRIELLSDKHTFNIKVTRQLQQRLAPYMLSTLDLSGISIGINEQEKRQVLVELCDLQQLNAVRLDQLDNYTARIWNISIRYGGKWPKLELLSILRPDRSNPNLEWIDVISDQLGKRNLVLEILMTDMKHINGDKKFNTINNINKNIQPYHKSPLVNTLKRVRQLNAKNPLSLKNTIVVDILKYRDTSQIAPIGTWLLGQNVPAQTTNQRSITQPRAQNIG